MPNSASCGKNQDQADQEHAHRARQLSARPDGPGSSRFTFVSPRGEVSGRVASSQARNALTGQLAVLLSLPLGFPGKIPCPTHPR
jgi:hypothetical protein